MLVGLVLVVALTAAAPGARTRTVCDRRGTTITENARARLFFVNAPGGLGRIYYGCLRQRGAIRRLGADQGGGANVSAQFLQLSGRLAGLVRSVCIGADCGYTAKSIDLRSGRVLRQSGRTGEPRALVMTSAGSLAVLAMLPYDGPPGLPQFEIRRIDRTGVTVLDVSSDIDPSSLAVGGSWIYWTRAGQPQSAPIN